jgi:NAD(P)-dependent dehydrogenase (short-subunit alcohol dehydrogenase family)
VALPTTTIADYSSGIGLAAAKHLARHGLNVVMVDVAQSLDASAKEVKQVEGSGDVVPVHCDVSNIEDVVKLREQVLDTYGECQVLMNNAGISRPTPAFSLDRDLKDLQSDWAAVLGVNMNGIINVAQAFAPFMSRQENESVIINTGSKQGITCPPGKAGYNVSKAAVKVFTEQRGCILSWPS